MYKNLQISLSLLRQGTSYRKTFSENIPKEWITRKKILRCCYSSIRKSGHIWKHVEWGKSCRLGEKVTTWCLWTNQRQEVDTQMPNKIWSAIIDYKHESLFFWDLLSDGVIETADMPWRREAAQFAISCDWQLKTEIQVRPFFLFFKKNLIVLFSFPCMSKWKCPMSVVSEKRL